MTRWPLWPAVLVGWGLAAAVLTLIAVQAIAHLWFPDPDDAMRLMEVRDWIAGQSWWDVSQHRMAGSGANGTFAMHWSRIVDLPIALVMAIVEPVAGSAAAARTAMVAVPLAILLVVMALVARLTEILGGAERARLAVLLTALSPPILYQIRPMRIDHHGWQVMLALGAAVAILSRPTWRSGAVAGLCLATLVSVSLEGMPMTAAIFGVALLAWAVDPVAGRKGQTLAMAATLVGGVVMIHVAQRGPAMFAPACDAIAPVWIAALGVSGALAVATLLFAPVGRSPRLLATRVAALVAAGAAGAAIVRIGAPICAKGPFATLDPLVYSLWYRRVAEGLPAWDQSLGSNVMAYALPIVGLAGSVVALRGSAREAQPRWAMMAALAAAAFLFSLLIIRGAATANAFALPGAAWLLLGWLTRARAIGPVLPRTAATAAALLGAAPGLTGALLVEKPVAAGVTIDADARARTIPVCSESHEIADLSRLPTGTIFAPLDVTPAMVAWTAHRGIAGGYHRNADAVHRVLATFMGTPEAAERQVRASGADYVAGCPGENETEIYDHFAPRGFWARLERGERFAWLEPVAMPGSPVLAWRVKRLPGTALHP